MFDALYILGGGVLLYFGAEWLVHGSAGIARVFGVRTLVIGLTVVAYGTSAPEAVVSGFAAFDGNGAIAIGNVIGSNIANLGLILGVTALIAPAPVEESMIRREVPVLLAATLMVPVVLWNGQVDRIEGAALVAGAVAFTIWQVWLARQPGEHAAELEAEAGQIAATDGKGKLAILSLVGLVGLLAGGKLFVDGAVGLADRFGVDQRVIGLTVVAIGTSLPELAAAIVAALRRHTQLALGNVVGSNIFNVLLIVGLAALIRPLDVPFASVRWDVAFMVGITAMSVVMLRAGHLVSRWDGALLLVTYAGFLGVVAWTM